MDGKELAVVGHMIKVEQIMLAPDVKQERINSKSEISEFVDWKKEKYY